MATEWTREFLTCVKLDENTKNLALKKISDLKENYSECMESIGFNFGTNLDGYELYAYKSGSLYLCKSKQGKHYLIFRNSLKNPQTIGHPSECILDMMELAGPSRFINVEDNIYVLTLDVKEKKFYLMKIYDFENAKYILDKSNVDSFPFFNDDQEEKEVAAIGEINFDDAVISQSIDRCALVFAYSKEKNRGYIQCVDLCKCEPSVEPLLITEDIESLVGCFTGWNVFYPLYKTIHGEVKGARILVNREPKNIE